MLKSHAYSTGPVAVLMQKLAPRVRVFGGMSTDFGQAASPHPAEGMRLFIDEMLRAGVPPATIDLMARRNPARLLGPA